MIATKKKHIFSPLQTTCVFTFSQHSGEETCNAQALAGKIIQNFNYFFRLNISFFVSAKTLIATKKKNFFSFANYICIYFFLAE